MAKIKCSLVLSGSALDPREVSRRAGVVPTGTWKAGDLVVPAGTRRRKDNGWKLSVVRSDCPSIEDVLRELLETLAPKRAAFLSIIEEHGLQVEFACAVYLNDDDSVPSIHLDREMIAALHSYPAEFDVDVYPAPSHLPGNGGT